MRATSIAISRFATPVPTLTLRGLTLRSGQANDFGGAAFVRAGCRLVRARFALLQQRCGDPAAAPIAGEAGSSLGVLNSSFDLNSAGSGGAIAKTGQLTIADSRFSENAATDQGGALQWWFSHRR
jgi:predicted outer membrane repeat protein